jgi:serine/threonine protein kinase
MGVFGCCATEWRKPEYSGCRDNSIPALTESVKTMEIQQRFERYTITDIIGEGGMGLVGKAVDAEGNVVAIKQLKEHILGHHEALARFEREQRVQSVLQHPNIVPLIEAGEVDGIPYFVMPFVEGESLSQRLRRGALSYKQAWAVIRDIGSALTFAHQNNILHRDIKPGNIMLHPEGRAYLTDFGIATDPDVNPSLQTRTIHLSGMGTPDYMAPEVLRGQRSTQLSEIYSFGVTIYEMLTGQRYVNALHQNENPWDGLPSELAQVLQRATHVSLPARYPHMSAFTDDCLRVLTVLANQPKAKQKPRPAQAQTSAPTPQFFTASPQYIDTEPQPAAPSYRLVFTIGMTLVLVATIVFFMLMLPPSQPPALYASYLTGTALAEQMRNVQALSLTASQSVAAELTTAAPTVTFTMTPTETPLVPIRQTETAIVATQQFIQTAEVVVVNQTATVLAQTQIADFNQRAAPVGTALYAQRDTLILFSVDSLSGERLARGTVVTVSYHLQGIHTYFFNGQNYYYVQPQNTGVGWVLASDLSITNPNSVLPPESNLDNNQGQQPVVIAENAPPAAGYVLGQMLFIDSRQTGNGIVYLQPDARFIADFSRPVIHGTQVSIIGDAQFQILDTAAGIGQWWWLVRDAYGQEGYIEEGYLVTNPPPRLTPTATSRSDLAAWGSGTVLDPIVTTNNFAVTLTGHYRYDAEFNDYFWEAITPNGTLGWVRQSHWQATTINNYPPLEPWGQGTALTNPNPANLRINPNHSATIVVQIIAGSRLVAVGNFHFDEASDQWWWLVTANRTTGWIPQSELREP